jgi:hypothetical protein
LIEQLNLHGWKRCKMTKQQSERLAIVNIILSEIAPGTTVSKSLRGWIVTWHKYRKGTISKRWCTDKGGHNPSWGDSWCHGGTCQRALVMLMRWLQEKTVPPMRVWRRHQKNGLKIKSLHLLSEAGWPEEPMCIVCDHPVLLTQTVDWWQIGKIDGPCHHFANCDTHKRNAIIDKFCK